MLRRKFVQAMAGAGLLSTAVAGTAAADASPTSDCKSVAGTVWKGTFTVSGGPTLRASVVFQAGQTLTLSNPDEDPGGRVGLGKWDQQGHAVSLRVLQYAADGTYAVILLQGTVNDKTLTLQGTSTDYNEQGQPQGSFNITGNAVLFFG